MAWKAFLESVGDNSSPDSSVVVQVRFEETGGKQFTNQYTLQAYNFSSLQSVKDLVLGELQKLNQFDSVVTFLKPLVGKEIK